MRKPRLYIPELSPGAATLEMSGAPFQHATRVLRLGVGAELVLFDGQGNEFNGLIEQIDRTTALVRLEEVALVDREPPLRWELVQGISRGERMDYTLQKSVELGVAAIHPVETRRSMVKLYGDRATRRLAHWQGVVTSACEQSGRTRIPEIAAIAPFDDFLAKRADEQLMLLLDPQGTHTLKDLPEEPPNRVLLVAGPEGGFDEREREAAYRAGATGLRVGPRILRTETAALVAAALLLGRWGDLA